MPNSDERKSMKSGTRDEAEGKWHKVNGKIKKIAGTLGDNLYLEQKVKKKSESASSIIIGEIHKVVEINKG